MLASRAVDEVREAEGCACLRRIHPALPGGAEQPHLGHRGHQRGGTDALEHVPRFHRVGEEPQQIRDLRWEPLQSFEQIGADASQRLSRVRRAAWRTPDA
ncbi:hypothetical protein D3C85_1073430 [compost metagenome]